MTVTQFTILQALQLAGTVTQRRLGEILAIDSTTLTRSLRPLLSNHWVQRAEGEDRRAWRLSLATRGSAAYEAAVPDWEAAQEALRTQFGKSEWQTAFELFDRVTTTVQQKGDGK